MSHFYLTLPSNSSQQFFPENTMTEFTTKLPSTIELTDEWEVGLAEIMFPRNWSTIPKDGVDVKVDYHDHIEDFDSFEEPSNSSDYVIKIHLRGGYYYSIDELINELNKAGAREFPSTLTHEVMKVEFTKPVANAFPSFHKVNIKPPIFGYDQTARRVFVAIPSGMSVTLPPVLQSILGFIDEQNPLIYEAKEDSTIKAESTYDLRVGIHALYVYCDLLQFTNVGDIKAPLLRVVSSETEIGDVVTRYYERPRYIPLQKKSFDSIQILIRDDLGEKIRFETGKVLLILHFRRVFNRYLL